MLLMLSWVDGETPHLEFLPENDWVTAAMKLVSAVVAGRSVQLWRAAGSELKMVYPAAEMATTEGALIPK